MTTVLLSYDLNAPGKKYEELYEKIKAYGTWCRVVESTWIVLNASATASSVYEDLRTVLDDSDKIVCVDITGSALYGWLDEATLEWLKKVTL